jgi:hypothetical protein
MHLTPPSKDMGWQTALKKKIQHRPGIPSQSDKTGRRNKKNRNRKGGSQNIPTCR